MLLRQMVMNQRYCLNVPFIVGDQQRKIDWPSYGKSNQNEDGKIDWLSAIKLMYDIGNKCNEKSGMFHIFVKIQELDSR